MAATPHASILDIMVFAFVAIAMMVVGVFRLDSLFARKVPKATKEKRYRLAVARDEKGRSSLTDPDGRPSGRR
jgi:NADH:ubiquinone oxidoreductase subunit 3 (subunit A)